MNFRNHFLIYILILILSLVGGAEASLLGSSDSSLHRLDPVLRRLAAQPNSRPPSNVHVWTDSEGIQRISASLNVTPGTNLEPLTQLGIKINGGEGIVSAELPLNALSLLAQWPGLIYAETARRSSLLLDRSTPEIRAGMARTQFKTTGKGVLLGIVDSGIDIHHKDFQTPDGKTRIRALWDQTYQPATGELVNQPSSFKYGREYSSQEINAALASRTELPQKDDHPSYGGHGTHVAGIAGGDGEDTPFVGVAPEADLIVVKWNDVRGGDANEYIIKKAEEWGLPVVVNNSWGGHSGPHDGTDNESRQISRLLERNGSLIPGRAVVFAAGNSGKSYIHLSGSLKKGETGTLRINAPSGQTEFELELWADVKARFEYGIRYPDDLQGNKTEEVWAEDSTDFEEVVIDPDSESAYAGARLMLDPRDRPYPNNPSIQRFSLYVDLRNTQWGTVPGEKRSWTLLVKRTNEEGKDPFDGWITLGERLWFHSEGSGMRGDANKTLINQAATKHAIVVGASVSKTEWTSIEGKPFHPDATGSVSQRVDFSSIGPTRDGREKPDLLAPGQWIASSMSRDFTLPQSSNSYITPDGEHVHSEGTSMAAPHITGTAALMLELKPSLTAAEILEHLKRGARGYRAWSPREGVGRLDTFGALSRMQVAPAPLLGDVNKDRQVNVTDALIVLRLVVGLVEPTPELMRMADVAPAATPDQPVDGDGVVTIADGIRILQIGVGLDRSNAQAQAEDLVASP